MTAPAPVQTGQETPKGDRVAVVEASGGTGLGEARQGESKDADSGRSSEVTPVKKGERDDESDLDAMGKPKRRAVVGQRYSASKTRQLLSYAAAIAVIIGLYFGAMFAVDKLDRAPAHDTAQAPWAQPGASQAPAQRFQ